MDATTKMAATAPDPMALVRAIRRMEQAGFALSVEESGLAIVPASQLNEQQRAFLREHKPGLVALLTDSETLAALIEQAGTMGLGWREGTDWDDRRLLAAGEILYSQQRMVSVLGRRYSATVAPPTPRFKEASTVAENARLEVEPA